MKYGFNNIVKYIFLILLYLLFCIKLSHSNNASNPINVNKCCEKFEILFDLACSPANETDKWIPNFADENEKVISQINFKFVVGRPACKYHQSWPIYHYPGSVDKLMLLSSGLLRHYIYNSKIKDDNDDTMFYDHKPGQYCLEKAISTSGPSEEFLFAMVCSPDKEIDWSDIDFILRRIINPILHSISIITLFIVAIIYFVLPILRDLVGNIITTITFCIIIGQIASLVMIFTELRSSFSFLIADTMLYIGLLSAFLWLSAFGYYIWKTFRSKNVFLRITDGRKYCWYSSYIWGITIILSILALLSHYFLDSSIYKRRNFIDQETIGWLGLAIFFFPIAFTIIVDSFFFISTMNVIKRRTVYGRIQYKLRNNFVVFSYLFFVMTITWIFLILSWLGYNLLFYVFIFVNGIQSCSIFYICIIRQKNVTFLFKKSFCSNEQPSSDDWGDEMGYINAENYK